MGALKTPRRREPLPCNECGTPLWEAYAALCDTCHKVAYETFLKAMGWDREGG
jgi:hypothetical protein